VTGDDIVDEVYLKLPDDDDNENFDDHLPQPEQSSSVDKAVIQAAMKKAEEKR
jgi:hypothetical protein